MHTTLADSPLFFNEWENLARVLIVTPIFYLAVILFVRITGKRSTSQLNNFDWVVTVAIGSMLASPILLKDVTIAEGLLGIGLLFALQWLVTKLAYHSDPVTHAVRARPRILVYRGELLRDAMRRERVTEEEINSAVREHGHVDLDQVGMVVFESDAKLSVISRETLDAGEHLGAIRNLDMPADSPRGR